MKLESKRLVIVNHQAIADGAAAGLRAVQTSIDGPVGDGQSKHIFQSETDASAFCVGVQSGAIIAD